MYPENIEFLALMEASEWSGAEVARRLHREPATISRWKNGVDRADKTAVELFKFLLSREKPETITAIQAAQFNEGSLSPWEIKVLEDLRWLHTSDRDRVLKVMKTMIHDIPKRQPIVYKESETVKQGASHMLKKGAQAPRQTKSSYDQDVDKIAEAAEEIARKHPRSK